MGLCVAALCLHLAGAEELKHDPGHDVSEGSKMFSKLYRWLWKGSSLLWSLLKRAVIDEYDNTFLRPIHDIEADYM